MRKQLDFYGYNSPTSGRYFVDGEIYSLGEDYRTVKRYREYKNAGFNILLLQHENSFSGETFSDSACRKCMDAGYKAGLTRIIVSDTRLKQLCCEKQLVGETGKFKTQVEFYDYIDFCTRPYRSHPGFYGVQLFDEPSFDKLKSYAEVYAAIKELFPDMQVQCNLLNMCAPALLAENPGNVFDDFVDYLSCFVDNSGIDYLMTDEYAFRRNNTVSAFTIPTFQIMANVCKKRGIELRLVLQSFSQQGCALYNGVMDGGIAWRRVTEKDMYWQLNLAMGFGCREFSFFTYFTKQFLSFKGTRSVTDGVDGAAFINYDGTRTKLYGYTKRIISEIKSFEKVLLKYEYDDCWFFFEKGKSEKDFEYTEKALISENKCSLNVEISAGAAIVTRSKSENGELYMVENITNPAEQIIHRKRAADVKINICQSDGKINYYRRGELVDFNSKNGTIMLKMNCGDAVFLEILKQ